MNDDNLEVVAKLKLDTAEAEAQLKSLSAKSTKAATKDAVKLPKDTQKSLKELFSGDKGLKNVGKIAKSATTGINGVSNTLSGIAQEAGKAGIALGVAALAITAIVKLLQGTDTAAAIAEKATELFDRIREITAPFLSILGDIIMTLMQMVEDILPLLQPALDAIALSLKVVSKILTALEPIIRLVGRAFEFVYNIIKGLIKLLTFGLVDLDNLTGSTTATKQSTDKIRSSLDVWETTGGETPAEKQARLAAEAAKSAADAANSTYASSLNLGDDLAGVGTGLEDLTTGIGTGLGKLSEDVGKGLGDIASGLGSGLGSLAQGLGGAVEGTGKGVGAALEGAGKGIGAVIGGVGDAVSSIASTVWSGVKDVASGIGNAISSAFKKLKFWETGGTVDADIWGMNEKGNPEFLFSTAGRSTVVNADILEKAMYNAVKRANSEIDNKLEVSVKGGASVGPRELAQWILPALQFNLRRN